MRKPNQAATDRETLVYVEMRAAQLASELAADKTIVGAARRYAAFKAECDAWRELNNRGALTEIEDRQWGESIAAMNKAHSDLMGAVGQKPYLRPRLSDCPARLEGSSTPPPESADRPQRGDAGQAALCEGCEKNLATEFRECPYSLEFGGHNACDCCAGCRAKCAMDI